MSRIAALVIALVLPFSAMAAPESYTLDPYHTITHFEVSHFGFTNIRGHFEKNAAKFVIDRAAKTASLEVTVQTASVSTGDSERGSRPRSRDEHVKSPDFFNVVEFPAMIFKSTAVKFSGDNPAAVEGSLTLLGVTKPLTLNVEHWKCGPHPANKKEMCGGIAAGTMKRSEWGMKYGIPMLGDDTKLWVSFEGYKD